MALTKNILDIPLGGSIETKIASEFVPLGKSTQLYNADFRFAGLLTPRNEFAQVTPASSVDPVRTGAIVAQLGSYKDTLIATTRYSVRNSSSATPGFCGFATRRFGVSSSAWAQAKAGSHLPHTVRTEYIGRAMASSATLGKYIFHTDCAISNGYLILVYSRTNNTAVHSTYVSIFDATTMVCVQDETLIANLSGTVAPDDQDSHPIRVITQTDGRCFIIARETLANISVRQVTFAGLNPSIGAPTNIITDAGTHWDVCPASSTEYIVIYARAVPNVTVKKFNAAAQVGATLVPPPLGQSGVACAFEPGSGRVGIAMANATPSVQASFVIPASMTLAFAAVTVDATAVLSYSIAIACSTTTGAPGGELLHVFDARIVAIAGVLDPYIHQWRTVGSTGGLSAAVLFYGLGYYPTKPVFYNGSLSDADNTGIYMTVLGRGTVGATQQGSTYLLRFPIDGSAVTSYIGIQIVSRIWDTTSRYIYNIAANASTARDAFCPLILNPNVPHELLSVIAVVPQFAVDDANPASALFRMALVRINLNPSLAQGIVEFNALAVIAGGENSQFDGGTVHEIGFYHPPPFTGQVSTNIGGGGLVVGSTYSFIAIYVAEDDQGNVHYSQMSPPQSVTITAGNNATIGNIPAQHFTKRQRVYVQLYRTTAGGTIYYLTFVAEQLPDGSSGAVTLSSTDSDAVLQTHRLLYTSGGIVENAAPPPSQSACINNSRVFLYTDNDLIYFSKKKTLGEGVNFANSFTKRLLSDGSKRTTIAAMDGRVIAFRENSIQFFDGDGPTDNGQNDSFSDVRMIAANTGALPNTPVVLTDTGIFFRTVKGICLLDRGLSVQFIGTPVESFNNLTMVSAVNIPLERKVVFGHSNGEALVYDYQNQQWTTYDNSYAQNCATEYSGQYVFASTAAPPTVQLQDTALAGGSVSYLVKTPWIHIGAMQGFQRLWYVEVLERFQSNHDLNLAIFTDYNETSPVFSVVKSVTGTPGTPERIRTHFGKKCEAVQFQIAITPTTGGLGAYLTSLSLECGVKRGVYKLPLAQTV